MILLALSLSGTFQVRAQVSMPDSVCVGFTRRYWVVGSPGSAFTWKIDGQIQSSAAGYLEITWTRTGTFRLEVQEHLKNCSGEIQTGWITVLDSPELQKQPDIEACSSYVLPKISGTNLSGNEAYFDNSQADDGHRIAGPVTESSIVWIYDEMGNELHCSDETSFAVSIVHPPEVFAGDSFGICSGTNAELSGSAAKNFSSLLWTGTGDGLFDDPVTLHPVYTPGPNDWNTGSVNLMLTAKCQGQNNSCPEVQSSLTLMISSLIANVNTSDISCFGKNDGEILISDPVGGSGSFEYSIDGENWSVDPEFDQLAPGEYSIKMRDALTPGCLVSLATMNLTGPEILYGQVSPENTTCSGNDGSLTIRNASGGNGSYEYSLDNVRWSAENTFTGLKPGNYAVQIRDALFKNCLLPLETAEIKDLVVLEAGFSSASLSCFGRNDGIISVINPSGGSGNYEFSVDGQNWQLPASFTGLNAGEYALQMRDANSKTCALLIGTVILTEPDILTATLEYSNETYSAAQNGSITIANPLGGSGFYLFSLDGNNWQNSGIFNGLAPGSYQVRMRDEQAAACEMLFNTVEIDTDVKLLAEVSTKDVSCWGNQDGELCFHPLPGGMGNYEYSIDGGFSWQTPSTADGLFPGDYSVYLRDAGNSAYQIFLGIFRINQPDILQAKLSFSGETWLGANNGNISVQAASGGSGSYEYSADGIQWQNSGEFNQLVPGKYTVFIRDSQSPGCQVSLGTLEIVRGTSLTADLKLEGVRCYGERNGSVTVSNPKGGSGTYQFSMDDGKIWSDNGNFSNLPADLYPVWLRDANTPEIRVLLGNLSLPQPDRLVAWLTSDTPVEGTTNVTVHARGGTGNYSGTGSYSVTAGLHNFTVTDAAGCVSEPVSIEVEEVQQFEVEVSLTDPVRCFSGMARLEVNVNGGTAPYVYTLVDGNSELTQDHPVFRIRASDVPCQVQVVDRNGIVGRSQAFLVTEPAVLSLKTSSADAECFGEANGTATVSVTGGTEAYSYRWNDPSKQTTSAAVGLKAGRYEVEVTDFYGCSEKAEVFIGQPVARLTASATVNQVKCAGGNNGTVRVEPAGGTAPYSYLWNDTLAQTAPEATGLSAGTYKVIVTDNHACTFSTEVRVNQPEAELIASVNGTAPSCSNEADGSATASVSGGAPPYRYRWNDSLRQTSATAVNLRGGDYELTVTDANTCSFTASIRLAEAPAKLDVLTESTAVNCFGGNDGTATAIVSGGTGPYTFLWNDHQAQMDAKATLLQAGTYRVSVSGTGVCPASAEITVNQPEQELTVQLSAVDQPCYNEANGTAVAVVSGGTPPYSYLWNDGSQQTTATAKGLKAGIYEVSVSDQNGCIQSQSVSLFQAAAPLSVVLETSDVKCAGGADGSVLARVTGGTKPYVCIWNDEKAQQTPLASGLKAGIYQLTVTDTRNCSLTFTSIVTEPDSMVLKTTATNPICKGENNGQLSLEVTGGTGPYQFLWNDPMNQQSAVAAGLIAGTYSVWVTDVNACSARSVMILPEPDSILTVTISGNRLKCTGDRNGLATVVISGGVAPYTCRWDDPENQKGRIASGLTAGTYRAVVSDTAGCSVTREISFLQPDPLVIMETVTKPDYYHPDSGSIHLNVSGGTGPYRFSWNTGAVTRNIDQLGSGIYSVNVTDQYACERSESFRISDPNQPPEAADDWFTSACPGIEGNLMVNDLDPENDPFFTDQKPVKAPLHGTVTLTGDGSFYYQPSRDYAGTDRFEYAIYDTDRYLGDTASVWITVLPDFDCDGDPDELDADADGDGILLVDEGGKNLDTDGDGHPNYLDLDSDGDGIPDQVESRYDPNYPVFSGLDAESPERADFIPVDTDQDGIPDFLDPDSDQDGVPDFIEGHDFNADGKPDQAQSGNDQDGDGLDDAFDTSNRLSILRLKLAGIHAYFPDFDGDGKPDWRDSNDDDDLYLTRYEDLNMDGDFSNDDTDFDGNPEYLDYGRECDIFIPDAFSPNNDNVHDYFQIYCIDHYPNARLAVFDQSGKLVYTKEHYGNVTFWGAADRAWWNGKAERTSAAGKDGKVPAGTYFYWLELGNGEIRKSFVFVSYD